MAIMRTVVLYGAAGFGCACAAILLLALLASGRSSGPLEEGGLDRSPQFEPAPAPDRAHYAQRLALCEGIRSKWAEAREGAADRVASAEEFAGRRRLAGDALGVEVAEEIAAAAAADVIYLQAQVDDVDRLILYLRGKAQIKEQPR